MAKQDSKIYAVLFRKKTYTVFGVQYREGSVYPIDEKTARYLKTTRLFKLFKEEPTEEQLISLKRGKKNAPSEID